MKVQKVHGSSDGYIYEIGDIKFLYMKGWYERKAFTKPLGLGLGQNNATCELNPMAFEKDGEWVVCVNYNGDHSTGCALNVIAREKRGRVARYDFLEQYTEVYALAIQQEMANLSQNIRRMDE